MPLKGQIAPGAPAPTMPMPTMPVRMGYFSKLKMALFSPSELFYNVKYEPGFGAPLKFALITGLIVGIIFGVALFALMSILAPFLAMIPIIGPILGVFLFFAGPILIVMMIAMLLVIMLIGPFVSAAIVHVFAKLFKGTGKFSDSYKVVCYSMAPILFMWIPFVNFVAAIWELVILTVGISKLHAVSKGRAVLVWLLPVIIVVAVAFFLNPGIFGSTLQSGSLLGSPATSGCTTQDGVNWCYTISQPSGVTSGCYGSQDACAAAYQTAVGAG